MSRTRIFQYTYIHPFTLTCYIYIQTHTMAPKPIRRANNPADSTAIPPPLPPSVEEAYRRKCLQLKRRTNEVQEDNDAARVRLHRLRRGVEKLRLERAFLLDQLAKRTSTNVEDSEGSPSPPPTVRDEALHESQSQNLRPSAHSPSPAPAPARSVTGLLPRPRPKSNNNNNHDDKPASASASGIGNSGTGTDHDLPHRQPQEKPLRSKRGHRKPSVVATLDPNGPPATFASQGAPNLSPSSDAFSHSVTAGEGASSQQLKDLPEQRSNGVGGSSSSSKSAKKPTTAFDLYARDNREQASESKADGVTVEEELARGWKELTEGQRDEYKTKEKAEADVEADKEKAASEKKEERQKEEREEAERRRADSQQDADDTPARDEDEEMEVDD